MKKPFPKNIFIVWYQGYDAIPKNIFKQNLNNWQLLNPNWNVKLLDNNDLIKSCKKYSKKCLETYNSFKLLHMKIDFARYVHLYLYGGIYIDMDCYAFRSLEHSDIIFNLINNYEHNPKYTHLLGLSTLNLDPFESFIFCGSTKCINNAIMLANQKNSCLKKLIDNIILNNSPQFISNYINNYSNIQNITGPLMLNKFIQNYSTNYLNEIIYYFPSYVFEPNIPFGLSDITDFTIAIHKFEMSWISNDLKNIMSLYFKIKPNLIIIIIIILIFFLKKKYFYG